MKNKLSGLAVLDLDGTLLRGQTACEVLAESLGRLDRMQQFESLTLEQAIAAAREEMSSWYKDIPLMELTACLESATLAPRAFEGIDLLRKHSIAVAIASITWEFAVEWFARRLGIDHFIGTRLSDSGEIIHFWPRDKAEWVEGLGGNLNIPFDRLAAVGDSAGDVEMLRAVKYPVFVGKDMPTELNGVKQIPNGDILTVARWIVEALR